MSNIKQTKYLKIPKMVFPNPYCDDLENICFQLLYGNQGKESVQHSTYIVSIISAYCSLFDKTIKERDFIFREMARVKKQQINNNE